MEVTTEGVHANVLNDRGHVRANGRVGPILRWAYVLALPLFVWLSAPTIFVTEPGSLDAFFYSSLIHDYQEPLNRFGATYYAGRIAHVLPAGYLEHLLGSYLGYLVYHYIILSLASSAAYCFGRINYSSTVGLLASSFVCLTPWLFYSLASDHYDGVAATYLMCAQLIVMTTWRRPLIMHAAAGVILAIAANINQFTFFVFAMTFPGWLYLHAGKGFSKLLLQVAAGIGAFVIASGLLIVALRMSHPAWETQNPTMQVIQQLAAGGAASWFVPFETIMGREYYYSLAGFVLGAIAIILALVRAPDTSNVRPAIAATAVYAGGFVFFLAIHVILRGGALGLFYYLVYLFPAFLMIVCTIAGSAERQSGPKAFLAAGISSVVVCLAAWLLMDARAAAIWDQLINEWTALATGSAFVVATTVALLLRAKLVAAAAGMFAALFALFLPLQPDPLERLHTEPHKGWDIKQGGNFLVDRLQRVSPTKDGRIAFWYLPGVPALNSLQSFYFWGYSRIADIGVRTGAVAFDRPTIDALVKYPRIVLLGETDLEVDELLSLFAKFVKAGNGTYKVIDRQTYKGGEWGYSYALVERSLVDPRAEEFRNRRERSVIMASGAQVLSAAARFIPGPDGSRIVQTASPNGDYTLWYDIPDASKGTLRIRLEVKSGSIGGVITDAVDSNKWLSPEKVVAAGGGIDAILDFDIDASPAPKSLLIRNASAAGPSEAIIKAIEFFPASSNLSVEQN